jgi:hypothetical protein
MRCGGNYLYLMTHAGEIVLQINYVMADPAREDKVIRGDQCYLHW